jgi:YfiH family protein
MSLDADWLVPQWSAPARVRAVCTTRAGGFSAAPYASLNLGRSAGDAPADVQRNRERLEQGIGLAVRYTSQVHGCDVVQQPLAPDTIAQADGCFTQQAGVVCTVMVADCLPVLLTDTEGSFVAALHAGWRGLAGAQGRGILETFLDQKVASSLINTALNAPEIVAWLGPCIGPAAFEVGGDVRDAFVEHSAEAALAFVPGANPGKWDANLQLLARQRLHALGVRHVYGNDGSVPWCTFCNPSRFFSFRRDGVTGRHAASIWLA